MPGLEQLSAVTEALIATQKSPGVIRCKDKSATPAKKLVQARLPFKRLNPVPKKTDEGSDIKKAKTCSETAVIHNKLPNLNTSADDVENDCQMHAEIAPTVLQTVKRKGPLDHFIKKTGKISICVPLVTVDLTADSNSGLSDEACRTFNAAASSQIINGSLQNAKSQSGSLGAGQDDQSDVPMETEVPEHTTAIKYEDDTNTTKPYPSLTSIQEARPENEIVEKSKTDHSVKDVIFHMKFPVVVLEDIMTMKHAQMASIKGSMVSEIKVPEEVDSSPEDDSVQSSSNSPSVSDSSPDVQFVQNRNSVSHSSASTPVHKITENIVKRSTEKKKQREQEREEKRLKLQAEKEEREKLKEEARAAKERAKEEAKKKRDEEKGQKEKEKKEKKEKEDREKAEKLKLKEEKRKEKQEALEAKQEEKRKKEEEKRLKEEEKRIKAEKAEITRFFQKPKIPQAPKTFASFCGKFAPFEIKKNMALAPLCRVVFDQDAMEQFDNLIEEQNSEFSYLEDLSCQKPRTSGRTVVQHRSIGPIDSDAVMLENGETGEVQILTIPEVSLSSDSVLVTNGEKDGVPERRRFGRMKLLQFCENYRPAYWGTWNKMSETVHARNPWSMDYKLLDYEVDSDEEWEEEEPGESLSHSEGDEDDEAGEDEEEDDGFFVPHGYLSEDEGASEEEKIDPEHQKVHQKLKAKEWDELLSKEKKFHVLQPVVIGCVWEDAGVSKELRALQRFAVCILESAVAEEELVQEMSTKRAAKDQQILAQLLPLLHGNVNSSKVIIQEFQEYCRRGLLIDGATAPGSNSASPTSPNTSRPQTPTTNEENAIPSKARLKRIISENSVYEKRPDYRMCWYVHAEVLRSFDREDLSVPCQWLYLTQVKEDNSNAATGGGLTQTMPVSVKRKPTGSMSITKFMRKPREVQQAEVVEVDGFQADTEEEENEDPDCLIVDMEPVSMVMSTQTAKPEEEMETEPSNHAVVHPLDSA